MRALTVIPGKRDSVAVVDVPEPALDGDSLLVQALAVGICGTDLEIVAGRYGWAPPGRERLTIGHESLGRILEAPPDSGFAVGDLVVGIVRRPDPVPCRYCAADEWDMCRNGSYTERGIKERDGYASERFRLEPPFGVPVDARLGARAILIEPASIVAKAWDHADRIGGRSAAWRPQSVLVTGAGPIGLLAALMGRQRSLEVHVFDQVADGPKPQLVRDLGATYHSGELATLGRLEPDLVLECTGASPVIADVLTRSGRSGVVCLIGVPSGERTIDLDLGRVSRQVVLENDAIFGSVNANRAHYESAAAALVRADPAWLSRLISRRVPLDRWRDAFIPQRDDVKVLLEFESYP